MVQHTYAFCPSNDLGHCTHMYKYRTILVHVNSVQWRLMAFGGGVVALSSKRGCFLLHPTMPHSAHNHTIVACRGMHRGRNCNDCKPISGYRCDTHHSPPPPLYTLAGPLVEHHHDTHNNCSGLLRSECRHTKRGWGVGGLAAAPTDRVSQHDHHRDAMQ